MFKLISLLVRSISNFRKRKTILTWCRMQKAYFIFLKELTRKRHRNVLENRMGKCEYYGPWQLKFMWGGNARKDVYCTIHSKMMDPSVRYIILKPELEDKMCVLINIYAHNKYTNIFNFLDNFLMTMRKIDFDGEDIILVGILIVLLIQFLIRKGVHVLIPRKSL